MLTILASIIFFTSLCVYLCFFNSNNAYADGFTKSNMACSGFEKYKESLCVGIFPIILKNGSAENMTRNDLFSF